jgi:hypothetical protein
MTHSPSASPRAPAPQGYQNLEALVSGKGDLAPLHDRLPRQYDELCVQPWKGELENESRAARSSASALVKVFSVPPLKVTLHKHADKAQQKLRLNDRKFSAFSRTAISLDDIGRLPSGRRLKSEQPPGPAVQAHVSPQVRRMEGDLLEYRREIETAFKTALVTQIREIQLNCKLKETLCYSCWVALRMVLSDTADDFQTDPLQVCPCCLTRRNVVTDVILTLMHN